jgi:hypothetical protein
MSVNLRCICEACGCRYENPEDYEGDPRECPECGTQCGHPDYHWVDDRDEDDNPWE